MLLKGVFSGLAASIIAYFLNTWLAGHMGDKIIYTVSPVLEEALKSGLAIFLGGEIVISHVVFGVVEAVHDYIASPDGVNARAASAGVASHLLFGAVTVLAMGYGPGQAIACAIIIHMLYNRAMVKGE